MIILCRLFVFLSNKLYNFKQFFAAGSCLAPLHNGRNPRQGWAYWLHGLPDIALFNTCNSRMNGKCADPGCGLFVFNL